MKTMVVYASAFGNTEKIAQAMGDALAAQPEVENETRLASDVGPEQLADLGLLIVGSPTQKFRPLGAINDFLKQIPQDGLRGVSVAAFDTRFTVDNIERIRILAFFVRLFGYAAKPIAKKLEKRGGELVVSPEGFFVLDTEGPLQGGELERAAEWAEHILAKVRAS